jgi:hypothetical protein
MTLVLVSTFSFTMDKTELNHLMDSAITGETRAIELETDLLNWSHSVEVWIPGSYNSQFACMEYRQLSLWAKTHSGMQSTGVGTVSYDDLNDPVIQKKLSLLFKLEKESSEGYSVYKTLGMDMNGYCKNTK